MGQIVENRSPTRAWKLLVCFGHMAWYVSHFFPYLRGCFIMFVMYLVRNTLIPWSNRPLYALVDLIGTADGVIGRQSLFRMEKTKDMLTNDQHIASFIMNSMIVNENDSRFDKPHDGLSWFTNFSWAQCFFCWRTFMRPPGRWKTVVNGTPFPCRHGGFGLPTHLLLLVSQVVGLDMELLQSLRILNSHKSCPVGSRNWFSWCQFNRVAVFSIGESSPQVCG